MISCSKTLVCTPKHPQKPLNTTKGVGSTIQVHMTTLHDDMCNFGVVWPIFDTIRRGSKCVAFLVDFQNFHVLVTFEPEGDRGYPLEGLQVAPGRSFGGSLGEIEEN